MTRIQRAKLKGKPCNFKFLRVENEVHDVRNWCHENASKHKEKISRTVSQIENEMKCDLDYQLEDIT